MTAYYDITLNVDRIQQSTDYFCGAACAAMVLSHFEVFVDQGKIYNEIQIKNTEPDIWYSDPDGVSEVLNLYRTAGRYEIEADDFDNAHQNTVLKRLYFNLITLRMPAILLVRDGDHWVIVDGLRFSESESGEREFAGVWVTDPFRTEPFRKFVSANEFLKLYLTKNKYGKKWRQRFVVISEKVSPNLISTLGSWNGKVTVKAGGGNADIVKLVGNSYGFDLKIQARGGGGEVAPVEIFDESENSTYQVFRTQRRLGGGKNGFGRPLMAISTFGSDFDLLELLVGDSAFSVLSDRDVQEFVLLKMGKRPQTIDKRLFWSNISMCRSRFTYYRKASLDGGTIYIFSNGAVLESLAGGTKAGG